MEQELKALKKKEIIAGMIYHMSMILLMFLCVILMLSTEMVLAVVAAFIGVCSIYGFVKSICRYYFFTKENSLKKI